MIVTEIKSPSVALALSLGTTAAGYGLFFYGEQIENDALRTTGSLLGFIGPTTGHFYAEQTWNPGLKYRLLGMGGMLVGLVVAFGACPPFGNDCNDAGAVFGVVLAGAGAVTYLGALIYEISSAPAAARKYNQDSRSYRS